MKTAIPVATGLLLVVANAGAADIAGKWGIGASVFNSTLETSLIHGHSNRTAWVFDVQVSGQAHDLALDGPFGVPGLPAVEENANTNQWRIAAGPALRRYTRPESDFSPYGDVSVSFAYAHTHGGGDFVLPTSVQQVGAATGLRFGLEYFTHRHVSLAADTNVMSLTWNRSTRRVDRSGRVTNTIQERFGFRASVAPRLVLRAYF